ncbi:MAG: hypothetical protein K8H84_01785 [Sulfuricella denitrificans]|nr:hypothetical protein [Sulfuricella denitrificans]
MKPQLKSNELLERVIHLSRDDLQNRFLLHALKKDAERLLSSDAIGAYHVLGLINAFLGEGQASIDNFEKAIRLEPQDYVLRSNYANKLADMGFLNEAIEQAQIAYKLNVGDPGAASDVLQCCMISARFEQAAYWAELLEKMKHLEKEQYLGGLVSTIKFYMDSGIPESEWVNKANTAFDILHDHGIYSFDLNTSILEDEDSYFLSYVVGVNRDVETVSDLNFELAERLAMMDTAPELSTAMSVLFTSLQ